MHDAHAGEAERLRLDDAALRADFDRIDLDVAAGAQALFGEVVAATPLDDEQALVPGGTAPTGGTITVNARRPPWPYFAGTFTLDWDSTAAAAQAAAEAGFFGLGRVVVTGGPLPGAALHFTFVGLDGNRPMPTMVADGSGLTGGDDTTTIGFVHTQLGEGLFPTVPQAYYKVRVMAVYGEQVEGGLADLTALTGNYAYVANLGNAIPPVGQQWLATRCTNRWVTVYG